MKKILGASFWLVAMSGMSLAYADDYLCREIGNKWMWFSDHAATSIEYVIVGPADRRYEVRTGVMIMASPRGWHTQDSGIAKVTAWGLGALHIRKDDAGAPFKICVGPGELEPITILKLEF